MQKILEIKSSTMKRKQPRRNSSTKSRDKLVDGLEVAANLLNVDDVRKDQKITQVKEAFKKIII